MRGRALDRETMDAKRSAHEQAIDGFIRRKLEAAGVRPTRQRVDLGRVIFGAGDRHFTAEMLYQETRSIRFAPTLGTIYNTLNEFVRCGLLREIAIYDAKLWYDTKTGPHFHFYREDTEELSDIPDEWLPDDRHSRARRHARRIDRRHRAAEEDLIDQVGRGHPAKAGSPQEDAGARSPPQTRDPRIDAERDRRQDTAPTTAA